MAASSSYFRSFDPALGRDRTRVLTADEQPLTLMGIRNLINEHRDLEVCAECGTWTDLLTQAQEQSPDVIVLSEGLYSAERANYHELMSTAGPECSVLLLSGHRDIDLHRDALCSGIRGILLKDSPTAQIVRAIREVQKGSLWFERSLTERVVVELVSQKKAKSDPDEAKIASLTQREREVICLISQGLTNKKIASRLFISEATVSHHLTSIFRKLEVGDRLLLVIFAFKKGLVQLP